MQKVVYEIEHPANLYFDSVIAIHSPLLYGVVFKRNYARKNKNVKQNVPCYD